MSFEKTKNNRQKHFTPLTFPDNDSVISAKALRVLSLRNGSRSFILITGIDDLIVSPESLEMLMLEPSWGQHRVQPMLQ